MCIDLSKVVRKAVVDAGFEHIKDVVECTGVSRQIIKRMYNNDKGVKLNDVEIVLTALGKKSAIIDLENHASKIRDAGLTVEDMARILKINK